MLDYFTFLKESTIFFETRHKTIHHQTKQLLLLCGAADVSVIGYELFENTMALLGNEKFTKEDWKTLMARHDLKGSTIRFPDLLGLCTDRREVLIELIGLPQLHDSMKLLLKLSPQVREFHRELIGRFARLLTQIVGKWQVIPNSVTALRQDTRRALFAVDIARALWCYRLLVNKVDKILMVKKGFIPFDVAATPEHISQVTEYVDRGDSIAFAIFDI
jgi:hypothetical protein